MQTFRVNHLAASLEEYQEEDKEIQLPDFNNALSASLEDMDVVKTIGKVILLAAAVTAVAMAAGYAIGWIGHKLLGHSSGGGGGGGGGSSFRNVSVTYEFRSRASSSRESADDLKRRVDEYVRDFDKNYEEAKANSKSNMRKPHPVKRPPIKFPGFFVLMDEQGGPSFAKKSIEAGLRMSSACEEFLKVEGSRFLHACKQNKQTAQDYTLTQSSVDKLFDIVYECFIGIFSREAVGNNSFKSLEQANATFSELTSKIRASEKTIEAPGMLDLSKASVLLQSAAMEIERHSNKVMESAERFKSGLEHFNAEAKPLMDKKSTDGDMAASLKTAMNTSRRLLETVIHLGTFGLGIGLQYHFAIQSVSSQIKHSMR